MPESSVSTSSNGSPDASSRPKRIRRRLVAYRAARRQQRSSHRPPPRVAVPSFFTLMNLFCGFLALTQIMDGAFVMACWLIVLAAFFDLLDGMMARLANAVSPFGVELDSLSDVVSFGLAPSFLVYAYALDAYPPIGMIVAALPALCGSVRLARYNVSFDSDTTTDYFEGLPIPGQAMALVALVLTAETSAWGGYLHLSEFTTILPIVVVLAGLMVSSIRFDAIPKPTIQYMRVHPQKTAAYVMAGGLILGLQEVGLLVVLAAYLTHGIFRAVVRLVDALSTPAPEEVDA